MLQKSHCKSPAAPARGVSGVMFEALHSHSCRSFNTTPSSRGDDPRRGIVPPRCVAAARRAVIAIRNPSLVSEFQWDWPACQASTAAGQTFMNKNTSPSSPEASRFPTAKRRAFLIVLLVAGLAVLASSGRLHAALMTLLPNIEAIIRENAVLGASIFILFAALSAMMAFVSSAVIVPVGVYVWGKTITVLLLWTGWMLGGV